MFFVLIVVFITTMIIDRALYLCKAVKWKLYYQLFTIVVLHVWVMAVLPIYTQT